ncbi:MAG: flagellar filament capping protein FliD [Alphaproteobacteria bacterium]
MADLVTSGTSTFVSGTSGLDTATLIEVSVQSKTVKADRIDIEVDENQAEISAYQELETLAEDFQDAIDALVVVDSLNAEDESIFENKTGFLTASDGTDVATLLDVSLDDGVAEAEYDIVILQKAEEAKVTGTAVVDDTAALGYTGSFNIGLSGGSSVQIDITAGQSLQDLATAINAQSETSGVQASIIKVSETEFQLTLTGTQTAQDIEVSVVSGDDILQNIGITDAGGAFTNVIQSAQNAIIELDGIQISRDDNSFDDVLDGVSLQIENAAPGTTINLEITNDTEGVKEAIENFVEAYNALRNFVVAQQTVTEDGATDGALFSNLLLENLSFQITDVLGASYGDNGIIEGLSDIGITLTNNNLLSIDSTELDDAILDNFDELESLFTSNVSLENDQIALLNNDTTTASFDFTLDITVDGAGDITSAAVGGDSSLFTIDGTRIIGAEGGIYEGLTFSYQGGVSDSIDISIEQGISNVLYKTVDAFTNSVDGLIQQEVSTLQGQNEDLIAEAQDIRNNAEDFRQKEIARYAALETEINALQSLLDQIRAILGTNNDDN